MFLCARARARSIEWSRSSACACTSITHRVVVCSTCVNELRVLVVVVVIRLVLISSKRARAICARAQNLCVHKSAHSQMKNISCWTFEQQRWKLMDASARASQMSSCVTRYYYYYYCSGQARVDDKMCAICLYIHSYMNERWGQLASEHLKSIVCKVCSTSRIFIAPTRTQMTRLLCVRV